MKNQLDPLDPLAHAKDTLLDLAVRFGPKLLVAIFIITVGVFAAGWVARAIDRGLHRIDLEPPVRQLLTRVARVLVVGLFAIMALQNLGVDLRVFSIRAGCPGSSARQRRWKMDINCPSSRSQKIFHGRPDVSSRRHQVHRRI